MIKECYMLTSEKIDAIIAERYRLSKVFGDEWDYTIQLCWDQMTELLSKNMDETIAFFDNECSSEQYAWMSDVFDFVAKKTKSHEFVAALYRLAEKYPEETAENKLMYFIDDAASIVGYKR